MMTAEYPLVLTWDPDHEIREFETFAKDHIYRLDNNVSYYAGKNWIPIRETASLMAFIFLDTLGPPPEPDSIQARISRYEDLIDGLCDYLKGVYTELLIRVLIAHDVDPDGRIEPEIHDEWNSILNEIFESGFLVYIPQFNIKTFDDFPKDFSDPALLQSFFEMVPY